MNHPNGRLVVHIGCPKTGTSVIQSALFGMHDDLLKRSVSYPNLTGSGFGWQAERGVMAGNGELMRTGQPADDDAAWQNLLNRCGEMPPAEVQIVSSELLLEAAPHEYFWRELSDHAAAVGKEAVVVVYLRDPFPYILSGYSQVVKTNGVVKPFAEWVEDSPRENYFFVPHRDLDTMQAFAERYGCQLKVYRYEDARPNMVEHFLGTACGASVEGLEIPTRTINESLTPYDCSFHRGLNSVDIYAGKLMAWQRTDTQTKGSRVSAGEPGRFELNPFGEAALNRFFEEYRSMLERCTDFADRVDYSIDRRRLTARYTTEEAGVHQKFFELGQIVAHAYLTGYFRWDIENASK